MGSYNFTQILRCWLLPHSQHLKGLIAKGQISLEQKKRLTKWLLHGFHPTRNSVQTGSLQIHAGHQLPPR